MTNEEMAQMLMDQVREYRDNGYLNADQNAYSRGIHDRLMECVKAGAAALRAMEWHPIADNVYNLGPLDCFGGYFNGLWIIRNNISSKAARALGYTHMAELPAPPKEPRS